METEALIAALKKRIHAAKFELGIAEQFPKQFAASIPVRRGYIEGLEYALSVAEMNVRNAERVTA